MLGSFLRSCRNEVFSSSLFFDDIVVVVVVGCIP